MKNELHSTEPIISIFRQIDGDQAVQHLVQQRLCSERRACHISRFAALFVSLLVQVAYTPSTATPAKGERDLKLGPIRV